LDLDASITLAGLELPQGAKILAADLDEVVVECVVPMEMPEEAAEAGEVEPEVIGAKKEEDESEEKD